MIARVRSAVDGTRGKSDASDQLYSEVASSLDGLARAKENLYASNRSLNTAIKNIEQLAYKESYRMPLYPSARPRSFRLRMLQALSLHSNLYRYCILLARYARTATAQRLRWR